MKTMFAAKTISADYALYEIPELDDTEFMLAVSPCPRIEDVNDVDDRRYSVLICMDGGDEISDA